jgi:hypothetical protein
MTEDVTQVNRTAHLNVAALSWPPPPPPGRRRWLAALIAAAVVIVLVAVVAVFDLGSRQSSSALLAYPAGCPGSPMNQVPNAKIYRVQVPCARISGTVTAYRLNAAYDDLELTVKPARSYGSVLPAANHGHFTVDIPVPSLNTVRSPDLGSDATFYGSWAESRATHALLLIPTWRVTATSSGGVNPYSLLFPVAENHHSGQAFDLVTGLPAALPPGTGLTIPVSTTWAGPAQGKHQAGSQPASQIRLVAEITGPAGEPVAWKAGVTSTLGLATIRVPLIVTTGRYTLHLYAIASGHVVSMTRGFDVGKA